MSRKPFLTKIHLQNFKSIQNQVVTFDNPLFLVGRNDSGKTNLLSAVSFLADCTAAPLRAVVERYGGFTYLSNIHMIGVHTPYEAPIYLRADFALPRRQHGHYAFAIGFVPGSADAYEVLQEQCVVTGEAGDESWFDREGRNFRTNVAGLGLILDPQSLALPVVGGVQAFAEVLKAFGAMRVYAIEPEAVRHSQEQKAGGYLSRDGSNIVDVLQRLADRDSHSLVRMQELLEPVSPSLTRLILVSGFGERTTLRFTQRASHNEDTVFPLSSMADGTLRALGLLVAAMQEPTPTLLAFDEPELYLHPRALSTIASLIRSASERSQVVLTTHSPELLDAKWLKAENLRVVERETGATHISRLGSAPVKALQQHLAGAGELLRSNVLDAAPLQPPTNTTSLFTTLPT